MARFYASIQGNRGEATRMGTPSSGIEGHIRGWNIGVKVQCLVNSEGKDEVRVWVTGGSNYSTSVEMVGKFTEDYFEQKNIRQCPYCGYDVHKDDDTCKHCGEGLYFEN